MAPKQLGFEDDEPPQKRTRGRRGGRHDRPYMCLRPSFLAFVCLSRFVLSLIGRFHVEEAQPCVLPEACSRALRR